MTRTRAQKQKLDTHKQLIPLTLGEWCIPMGGIKPDEIGLRVFILSLLGILVFAIVNLALVVAMEHSAMHHQCEKNYVLWPMACANLALYSLIFLSYFIVQTDLWARMTGALFSVLVFAMVLWWAVVNVRMAHICITFYAIKYPFLHTAMQCCGAFNMVLLVAFCTRECWLVYQQNSLGDEEDHDPSLITHVFYKQNAAFVPSLFVQEKITSYNQGVTEWTKCVDDRNTSLKNTLAQASKIHEQSRNQSQLLNQLTDVVKEAETKVTKTETLMKEQEVLITDMKGVVASLDDQLSGMGKKTESFSLGGKTSDMFKWSAISLMCCLTVGFLLLALPKWMHLFGISLGIRI